MSNNLYGSAADLLAANRRQSFDNRIAQARLNLGGSSLFSLLGILGQNSQENAPMQDDTFIDRSIRAVPQSIKDAQSYDIDKSLRSSTAGILANTPLNRAANTLSALNANAVNAKSRLGVQNAQTDIGLENNYLAKKDASLNRYNKNIADTLNRIRTNRNAQLNAAAGIGTNYFNEIQKAQNRVNAFEDQQSLSSSSLNSLLPLLQKFKGGLTGIN